MLKLRKLESYLELYYEGNKNAQKTPDNEVQ
jgi:hypothetical protein